MNQICLLTYEMSTLCPELSQDLNGNSQAAATRQKMAQLEQMLSALDQLRRVGVYALTCCELSQKYIRTIFYSLSRVL